MENREKRRRYLVIAKRTDLAAEACGMWREAAGETTKLPGVKSRSERSRGFELEWVEVLNSLGEQAIGKPKGTYISIDISPMIRREEGAMRAAAELLAERLAELLKLKNGESVLVCGLGNSAITSDSIGPEAARLTLATRHLTETMPEDFAAFRPTAVITAGVLGTTGIESADMVKAVSERLRPSAVIAVDALAARRMGRICRSLQLSDAGIVPGSGVGNARSELSRRTLGVPVIAIGVPTVVDAATLAADMMEQAGLKAESADIMAFAGDMVVTPREIDTQAAECAALIAAGINMALHELGYEDAAALMQ